MTFGTFVENDSEDNIDSDNVEDNDIDTIYCISAHLQDIDTHTISALEEQLIWDFSCS